MATLSKSVSYTVHPSETVSAADCTTIYIRCILNKNLLIIGLNINAPNLKYGFVLAIITGILIRYLTGAIELAILTLHTPWPINVILLHYHLVE